MRTYSSSKCHVRGTVYARTAKFSAVCLFAFLATFVFVGFASGDPIEANLQPVASDPNLLRDPHPNGYTIQEIIDAGGIIIGDKLFDSFYVSTTNSFGATAPGPSEIAITPIQILKGGAPLGGDFGMDFSGLWWAPGGTLADSVIEFHVQITDKYADLGYKIKDNGLFIRAKGNSTADGGISITEDVYAEPLSSMVDPIANKHVWFISEADQQLFDEAEFTPVVEMWIVKDVGASGGTVAGGAASLSSFRQTFSQIPEPGTLVLLGFGAIGLAAYAWRKRR